MVAAAGVRNLVASFYRGCASGEVQREGEWSDDGAFGFKAGALLAEWLAVPLVALDGSWNKTTNNVPRVPGLPLVFAGLSDDGAKAFLGNVCAQGALSGQRFLLLMTPDAKHLGGTCCADRA